MGIIIHLIEILLISILLSCSSPKVNKISNNHPVIDLDSVKSTNQKLIEVGPTRKFEPDHFIDKTKEYGLEGVKASHIYAVDFNNDGNTDLVTLENHYSIPVFYQKVVKKNKYEKINYNPFSENKRASFLIFADFNNDKVLDLISATLNQGSALRSYPLLLYKGSVKNGKVYYKLIKDGFPNKTTYPVASLSLLDYDLDGKLDLFQGHWFKTNKKGKTLIPDRLFKGDGLKFVDVSYLLEYEHKYIKKIKKFPHATPTFGSSTCDIDQNGYPDILTSNSSGYSNKLWVNLFDFKHNDRLFKEYGKESGFANDQVGKFQRLGGGKSFYGICFDYNNDGIMDVVSGELTHPYDQESRDKSSILTGKELSPSIKFIRSEFLLDYGNKNYSYSNKRAVTLDYNNDGRIDILMDNSGFPPNSRLILFEQETNHAYTDIAENIGINILNPSGTIKLDLNSDGLVDFISGQTNIRNSSIPTRLYVFENITKRHQRKSIRFFLEGDNANSNGIGAMIILKTNKNIYRQWVEYSYGAQSSQNEAGIHFGIGNELLDYVEVRWPISLKNKHGKNSLVFKKYDLSKFDYNTHFDVTLCESGRYMGGKGNCN
ncbi:MAG: CRTAC1 family protein, partial [Bdellovibrionales bacterium]|jgi:enediyne biosynthesis protein E4|nr:CRTAC1 family protein [Bdellovibrionales bacterium]